jgi:sulfate/thiosulfate transport system permease protein
MNFKLGLELSEGEKPDQKNKNRKDGFWLRTGLTLIAVSYLSLVLFFPVVNVGYIAFSKGFGPFFQALTGEDFMSALQLTLLIAAFVLPINTIFGLCAAWVIARNRFWGRTLLISMIDLPFAISPVVAGLMIVLLYGRNGWFGGFLEQQGWKIIFAPPGIILATAFVTLPFVAREVMPILEEVGSAEEEAARTLGASDWQIFWRVTVPNIRWGLLYGLLLTNARAMGEFGAVSVVSGNIVGATQTLPLYVEDAYKNYQSQPAFAASIVLAMLAVVTLILKEILARQTEKEPE